MTEATADVKVSVGTRFPEPRIRAWSAVFADIAITLEVVGAAPRFRLATDKGAVPRITALAITDGSTGEPTATCC